MLENMRSFAVFLVSLFTGSPCPEEAGLAQEEWFLRRNIRENEAKLIEARAYVKSFLDPEGYGDLEAIEAKLLRQRERLAILVNKRGG